MLESCGIASPEKIRTTEENCFHLLDSLNTLQLLSDGIGAGKEVDAMGKLVARVVGERGGFEGHRPVGKADDAGPVIGSGIGQAVLEESPAGDTGGAEDESGRHGRGIQSKGCDGSELG